MIAEKSQKEKIIEKRMFYEQFWRVIAVVMGIVFLVLVNNLYDFQTNPVYADIQKGTITELALAIPLALIIAGVRQLVIRRFKESAEQALCDQRFPLKEKRVERAKTHCKWMVDMCFYATTSIIGYVILQGLPNLPWFLGGNGQCINNFADPLHFHYKSPLINGFYILQCAQHLYSFVAHLLDNSPEAKAKFYETLLHHSLSIMLIMMSYLNNQTMVGIMVLFLHDCSDTFLIMARFYGDFRNKNKLLLNLIYFVCVFLWIMLRLVAFPVCCILETPTGIDRLMGYQESMRKAILLPGLFMIVMMGGLMVMHLFWTYFIFSAFGSLLSKKKVNTLRSY